MARNANWTVDVDGVPHSIVLKGNKLFVDDRPPVKLRSKNVWVRIFDYPIDFGTKVVNLVAIGTRLDLVINGRYLSTNEEYVPVDRAPAWTWVFIAISVIYPFVMFGGLLGALIGLAVSPFFVMQGLAVKRSMGARIGLSILILACIIGVQTVIGFFAAGLLY